jgi:hypothetical protein
MRTSGTGFEGRPGAGDEPAAVRPEPQAIADILREAVEAALHPAWRALRMAIEAGLTAPRACSESGGSDSR